MYRLGPEMPVVARGSGDLVSVSDRMIVALANNRTLDVTGIQADEGSHFSLPLHNTLVEDAGHGRLYIGQPEKARFMDLGRKKAYAIKVPSGWGFRHGWSTDGACMLFDTYASRNSLADRIFDSLGSVIVPVPEESNWESVAVVDTRSGRWLFHVEGPLLGPAGQYHADLSPSGKLVAVATREELAIYAVPDSPI